RGVKVEASMARRPTWSRYDRYPDESFGSGSFPVAVPVGAQRARARAALERLGKERTDLAPIVIEGKKIANTFWGKSWCTNLERYSDFANRLPRGRTYVR